MAAPAASAGFKANQDQRVDPSIDAATTAPSRSGTEPTPGFKTRPVVNNHRVEEDSDHCHWA
jgi:hypothetical protein